jgi:hypothetical protein
MIPGSVTSMGSDTPEEAFVQCTSLTSIVVDAQNSFYSSVDGVLFDKNQTTLIFYPEGRGSYAIPGSVTSIGQLAFESFAGAFGPTRVTIPGSVTNIGQGAFLNCTHLTNVYFKGNPPPSLGYSLFSGEIPTIYYLPGTTGWSNTFAGLPAVLWNPLIQAVGVQSNQFGFNITGTNNFTVVVEACTNLANPVWAPLQTLTLTNGSFYFSDPNWTNYSSRFYGLGLP